MKRSAGCIGLGAAVLLSCAVACSPDPLPQASIQDPVASTSASDSGDIVIDLGHSGVPFDRRLLGTNVPAWIGPERLADPEFVAAARQSGATLLRMPGGSWSNWYDWRACELADPTGCPFIGSARPTDFIDFMQATDLPGMWTVSINDSAQSAAAAVAFFNGAAEDDREIGVDRNGVDWATVGFWAGLRTRNGNAAPMTIDLWEVGNEVYGGRPDAGGEGCAAFGWEDVWTCDGTEYVNGDAEHDGYLAIRQAMLDVDPVISVGAVGVGVPDSWGDWGNEVMRSAGDALDFYVIHQYGFDRAPSPAAAVTRAGELWPGLIAGLRSELDEDVPIAVTEYNLVAVESADAELTMTQAMNALFLADTIGQLAQGGVEIANQWNLANGTTGSGTDYGMISLDDGSRFPSFEAMSMWSRAGTQLLPVLLDEDSLRVYPTRHPDGRLTVVILNLSNDAVTRRVGASGRALDTTAELISVSAENLTDSVMKTATSSALSSGGMLTVSLPGWSMNVLEIDAP